MIQLKDLSEHAFFQRNIFRTSVLLEEMIECKEESLIVQ